MSWKKTSTATREKKTSWRCRGPSLDDLLRSMAQLPADRKGRDALSAIERGLDAARLWRIRGLVGCGPRPPVGLDRPRSAHVPHAAHRDGGPRDDGPRAGTVSRRVGAIGRGDRPYAALHSTARHDWRSPPPGFGAERRPVPHSCRVVRDRRVGAQPRRHKPFADPPWRKKRTAPTPADRRRRSGRNSDQRLLPGQPTRRRSEPPACLPSRKTSGRRTIWRQQSPDMVDQLSGQLAQLLSGEDAKG